MDFTTIINEVKNGVAHLLFMDSNGDRIGSGSGFLSGGKLITCDHVIKMPFPIGTKVYIRFDDDPQNDLSKSVQLDTSDLISKVIASSPENENDFAILDIQGIDYGKRYKR